MDLMISEVQITFVILMGLTTLFLALVIPRYTVVGKTYETARKILAGGTLFVTIHFILQYLLHKTECEDVSTIRTLVNLSFGIPISYLFNMSNYYLQRKGQVAWVNWLLAPAFFLLTMGVLVEGVFSGHLQVTSFIMAVIYAFTLFYYGVLQLREYRRMIRVIHEGNDLSMLPFIRWIRWSLFSMIIVAFGFPLMTFNHNLLMRSLYGIISISVSFFYVLSFMGYGLNGDAKRYTTRLDDMDSQSSDLSSFRKKISSHIGQKISGQKDVRQVDEAKMERMKQLVKEFEEGDSYLQGGITLKEVADEMGVSPYLLRTWLHTTEFDKFSTWMLYLRLEKAKELLVNSPELGNDAIAERCGFCDRQYFQLQFRKHVGMTPSRWVKENFHSEE